jgi:hypothetical protein
LFSSPIYALRPGREPGEQNMRIPFLAAWVLIMVGTARADCVCRCVDGEVQAVCRNAIDLPPICAPSVCPVVPPSIAPISTPRIPPLGTSSCRQAQVLDPRTRRYEWRQLCD